MKKIFAYTLNSRLVWCDDQVQYIPVVSDMYRLHRVSILEDLNQTNCLSYVVKNYHRFEDELTFSPIKESDLETFKLVHEKIKIYMRLKDYVNFSYQSLFPAVLVTESDRLELLNRSLVDYTLLGNTALYKHENFILQVVADKKKKLMERYLKSVNEIKSAKTLNDIQEIEYTIAYERINVV